MDSLRIQLLGQLLLRNGDSGTLLLDSHRTEELFCYLLIHRHQKHHREILADLLCGECTNGQTKKRFRQILWRLQSALDESSASMNGPLLLVDRDWIQINPNYDLWLDVDIFERAWALVENRPGEGTRCRLS